MQEAGATADLGNGLHAGRRAGVYLRTGIDGRHRHRRLCAASELFLGTGHELLHGGGQDAGGAPALGQDGQAVQPEEPEELALRTHSQTSGWSLDRAGPVQQRDAHLHRGDGGSDSGHTQSLHTNALDEAIALPTDFSARIARNTQLFLQEETDICKVIDPWGGSYYVER
jgi:methylmalonyl-CoA mutase